MASNEKSKIWTYILVISIVAVLFYILIVAFAVTSIKGLSANTYWVDISIEKNNNIQAMRLSFEKVKRLNDNLFFHVGDSERIDDLENEISRNTDFIDKTIDDYRVDTIVAQEYVMIKNLTTLMSEHDSALAQMIEFARNDDKDAMAALLLATVSLQQNIDAEMQEISDIGQMMLEEQRFGSEARGNYTTYLLITVSVIGLIILIIISVCMLFAVKNKSPNEQEATTYERY